jgi:hypothetical protein
VTPFQSLPETDITPASDANTSYANISCEQSALQRKFVSPVCYQLVLEIERCPGSGVVTGGAGVPCRADEP